MSDGELEGAAGGAAATRKLPLISSLEANLKCRKHQFTHVSQTLWDGHNNKEAFKQNECNEDSLT